MYIHPLPLCIVNLRGGTLTWMHLMVVNGTTKKQTLSIQAKPNHHVLKQWVKMVTTEVDHHWNYLPLT